MSQIPEKKAASQYIEIFFLAGLLARLLISGRIYYWSNYFFLIWFSASYVLALIDKKSYLSLPAMLKLAIVLFFGGLIISMPFGIQTLYSARELMTFLGYLFILLSTIEIYSARSFVPVVGVIWTAAVFNCIFGLEQYFGGLDRSIAMSGRPELGLFEQVSLRRIFGFTFSPDFFACSLATSLVLLLGAGNQILKRIIPRRALRIIAFAFFCLLLFVPIILSRSFGGVLSFLVGIFALAAFKSGKFPGNRKVMLALAAGLIMVVLIFSLFAYHRRAQFFNAEANPVVLRLYNFQSGLKVWEERPALGVGVGNFWIAYPRYRPAQGNETRFVHNDFIQTLAEAGPGAATGLCLFVLFLLFQARKTAEHKDPLLISVWCALAVIWSHFLWDYALYTPELASIFFALLGGIVTLSVKSEERKIRWPLLSLLGLLAALLWFVSIWIFIEQRMVKKAETSPRSGNSELAASQCREALRMTPSDDYAEGLLARIAMQNHEQEDQIVPHFRRAMALNPRFAFWPRDLGDYYFHQGGLKLAETEWTKARELYPFNIDILARLSKAYRLEGDLERAEQLSSLALTISGDRRNALWEMFWVYAQEGKREKAQEMLMTLDQSYKDPAAKKLLNQFQNKEAQ